MVKRKSLTLSISSKGIEVVNTKKTIKKIIKGVPDYKKQARRMTKI